MLKYLIKKEFRQIQRNPFLPKMIFIFPVMVLLILPWAASYEIKNVNISIIDHDHSTYSNRLTNKIISSHYFKLTDTSNQYPSSLKSIEKDNSDIILEIPRYFEKNLITNQNVKVMVSANAVNGMKAGVGSTYLISIIKDFNSEIINDLFPSNNNQPSSTPMVQTNTLFRFNPHLNYRVFMVPALMVMILTLLCGFLPAISIVFEKELGTMEQINVSPVPKSTFILAKLIPFWTIGLIVISIGFTIAWIIYGLTPAGSFLTIYTFSIIYIFTVSGLGLVISNYAQNLQQAMFVVFFFMLIFIMLSGLYTPIDSMPNWAKWMATFNPLKHFMAVMRAVYLKGSILSQLLVEFFFLVTFAIFFNGWAILSYKKKN